MIAVADITDALVSHALRLGVCETVNTHEPKNTPDQGVSCAIFANSGAPVGVASGLASTTMRLQFTNRLYMPMVREPQDDIDPAMLTALDTFMDAYSADFELDGLAHSVDLLGAYGTPLSYEFGYLNIGGGMFRIGDIFIPLVLNDTYEQVA